MARVQVAHYLRADTHPLASRIVHLLQKAPPEAWELMDTLPLDLVAAIMRALPHPDSLVAHAPQRWLAPSLRASLQTANCGLRTVHADHAWASQTEPPADDSDSVEGSDALRGLTASTATLEAASRALAEVEELQWLRLEPQPLRQRVESLGGVAVSADLCARQWRGLEVLVAAVVDPSTVLWPTADGGVHDFVRAAAFDAVVHGHWTSVPLPRPAAPALWPHLAALTQLRGLDVSRCGLGEADVAALAAVLPRLPSLVHFNAADCNGQASLLPACAHLPCLRSLNISAGLRPLAHTPLLPVPPLTALTALHSLDISGHRVHIAHLVYALGHLPGLRMLRSSVKMRGEAVSTKVWQQADWGYSATPSQLSLRHLFADCDVSPSRSAAAFLGMVKTQVHLRSLHLSGCVARGDLDEGDWQSTGAHQMPALHSLRLPHLRTDSPFAGHLVNWLTGVTRLALSMFPPDLSALPAVQSLVVCSKYEAWADELVALRASLQLPRLEAVYLSCPVGGALRCLGHVIRPSGPPLAALRVLDVAGFRLGFDSDVVWRGEDCNAGLAGALARLPALRALRVAATPAVAAAARSIAVLPQLEELALHWRGYEDELCRASFPEMRALPELLQLLDALAAAPTLRVLSLQNAAGCKEPTWELEASREHAAVLKLPQLQVLSLMPLLARGLEEEGAVDNLRAGLPHLRVLSIGERAGRAATRQRCPDDADQLPPKLFLFDV